MGIAGIISDHKGSVARDVQITIQDWEAMKLIAAEQARLQGITLPTEGGATQAPLFGEEPATPAATATPSVPAAATPPPPVKPAPTSGPVRDRAAKSLAVDHNANTAPPFDATNEVVTDDDDLGETSWDAEEDEDTQPKRRSA